MIRTKLRSQRCTKPMRSNTWSHNVSNICSAAVSLKRDQRRGFWPAPKMGFSVGSPVRAAMQLVRRSLIFREKCLWCMLGGARRAFQSQTPERGWTRAELERQGNKGCRGSFLRRSACGAILSLSDRWVEKNYPNEKRCKHRLQETLVDERRFCPKYTHPEEKIETLQAK